jgi:hypothetical protein
MASNSVTDGFGQAARSLGFCRGGTVVDLRCTQQRRDETGYAARSIAVSCTGYEYIRRSPAMNVLVSA